MFPSDYFTGFFFPRGFFPSAGAPPIPSNSGSLLGRFFFPPEGALRLSFRSTFFNEGVPTLDTTQTNSMNMALAEAERIAWNANAPKVGLFQNNFNPSPVMTTADLTPADYEGYALQNLTFGPVFVDSNGKLSSIANKEFYSDPAGTIEQTIYGVYALNTLTGVLAAAKFPTTRPMGLPGEAIPVQLLLHGGILTLSEQI